MLLYNPRFFFRRFRLKGALRWRINNPVAVRKFPLDPATPFELTLELVGLKGKVSLNLLISL